MTNSDLYQATTEITALYTGDSPSAKATSATSATYSSTANYAKNGAKASSATSATYSSTANYAKNSAKATSATSASYAGTANYCSGLVTMTSNLAFVTNDSGYASKSVDFSEDINSQYSTLYNKKLIGVVEAYSGHSSIPITGFFIQDNTVTVSIYFSGGASGPHPGRVTCLFM